MSSRKRARESQAAAEERAMKRIDRAVKKYGTTAVAKYYSPGRAFKPEMKYFDTQWVTTVNSGNDWSAGNIPMTAYMNADGSTVSAYTDCALIPSATGNGYGQVIGNKYVIKKLKIRGVLYPTPDSLDTVVNQAKRVRVMLVQDSQPNGAQAVPSAFLTDWGDVETNLQSFMSISSGSGGRFRILYDKIFVLETQAAANDAAATTISSVQKTQQFTITKTWKKGLKVVIKSGGSTPAIAQLSDMNIYLVMKCYTIGSAVNTAGLARCSYMD